MGGMWEGYGNRTGRICEEKKVDGYEIGSSKQFSPLVMGGDVNAKTILKGSRLRLAVHV